MRLGVAAQGVRVLSTHFQPAPGTALRHHTGPDSDTLTAVLARSTDHERRVPPT
jgi:hypothetical protein